MNSKRYAERWRPRARRHEHPYLAWCRTQPCAMCGSRPAEAHHHSMRQRGIGQKADDKDAFPLCPRRCHVPGLHALAGPFKGWEKEQLRAWQDEQVALHRERYEATLAL